MKQRFNALDIKAAIQELKSAFAGCRVNNIYDIDNKTYLIKLTKPEGKAMILIESGIRIHGTEFEWPKNTIPSGFSMKLRKHLRSRRMENVSQVGADRIVDLQFGSGEAAYHLIVELYDRGNILLTDFEYTIISVLRPRTDQDTDVRFSVREKYPLHLAKQPEELSLDKLKEIFSGAKDNDDVRRILTTNLSYGSALIDHCLADYSDKLIVGKSFSISTDVDKLYTDLLQAERIFKELDAGNIKGYIIEKRTKAIKLDNQKTIGDEEIVTYDEFHPYLFRKFETSHYKEFESFDKAVDEFFSKLESQKIEIKQLQQNKEAVKKLENVKKDHHKRIEELKRSQTEDELKAQLIELNLSLVDRAIYLINSTIANQLDWNEINEIVDEAKEQGHEVAMAIKGLKLEVNHILLELGDPDEEDSTVTRTVEIDLSMNAQNNLKRYYMNKKSSIVKEQKTLDAGDKALKSAEKHTIELLKQANKTKAINKSRKPFWFEKFHWFISSENYLIIGGRDQQQNELVVKRYLRPGDLYVHADIQGASSVIIKNPSGNSVPPKTINEAGCMAVCYSVAWEAKVLTNAYWVHHDQVSKQAPSGEYLTTGSFMIRGKKNFIPQTALVFGLGLLYKLDDASVFRHADERRVKTNEEEETDRRLEMQTEFDDVKIDDDDESDNEQTEEKTSGEATSDNLQKLEPIADVNETDQDESSQFPDTTFQMKLVTNIEATKPDDQKESDESQDEENDDNQTEENTPGVQEERETESSAKNATSSKPASGKDKKEKPTEKGNTSQFKRGQKAKYQKMKAKYKDQDDEDKELAMQFLASSGKSSKKEANKPKSTTETGKKTNEAKKKGNSNQQTQQAPRNKPASTPQAVDLNEIDVDEDAAQTNEDEAKLLSSLTGNPLDEDELLFCVPVCAPYTTLQNYKHKVKLIPGTTKKGQAIKTAIEIFTRDKITTQREKDLIKANLFSKENDVIHNLPGKVKVSAPNMMKLKNKK